MLGARPQRAWGGSGGAVACARSARGHLRPASALVLAPLPLLFAAAFWLGPRFLWGQGWREASQLVARTVPSCAAAEAASRAWVAAFSEPRIDVHASAFWGSSPRTHARFDALPPMWATSPNLRVYGNASLDGHKTFVDVDFVMRLRSRGGAAAASGSGASVEPAVAAGSAAAATSASAGAAGASTSASAPCVIYSFGGNAEIDFEAAVLAALPACSVWQFDCTVTPERMEAAVARIPSADRPRFFFKPYCVGTDGSVVDIVYGDEGARHSTRATRRSVAAIMRELGHAQLDVLKMDVEGAEFEALPAYFAVQAQARSHLPPQISIELHGRGGDVSVTMAPVMELLRAGYILIARRDNLFGSPGCCTELTFALCREVDDASHAAGSLR